MSEDQGSAGELEVLREHYDALVEEHGAAIWRFAYRLTGARAHADDLTQEAFLQAWRSLGSLREPRASRSWLYAIAMNCQGKRLRTKSRRPQERAHLDAMPEVQARSLTPLDALAQRDAVETALRQMDAQPRVAFVLVFQEGFTCAEADHLLGVPRGTVLSRIHRARATLRAASGGEQASGQSAGQGGR